jgi:hypothetical protein
VNFLAIAKTTQIAAAVSSIALARRRAEHVPAAIALVILAAVPLARGPLKAALSVEPREDLHRALIYADGAAELATYATIAGLALAVAVTAQHRRRAFVLAVAAWALASVVLGALYPSPLVRGVGLQRFYFAADLVGLFVSAAALFLWAQRSIAAQRSPDSSSLVALCLVSLDGAILLAPFSPWRGVLFGSDYSGIQLVITLFFGTFFVAQVIAWRFSSRG